MVRVPPRLARSVWKKQAAQYRIDGVPSHHPSLQLMPAKQRLKGLMQNVEPAGIGAEGRHHQTAAIVRETAPPHHRAAPGDARDWMQMTDDLRACRILGWLMTEHDTPDRQGGADGAANA